MPQALFFAADDGTTGRELWRIGSDGALMRVADINSGASGSNISGFFGFRDALYFNAAPGDQQGPTSAAAPGDQPGMQSVS